MAGGLAPYFKQSEPERPSANQEWQRNNRNREFSFLKKNIDGSNGTISLTTDETNNRIIEFSGLLAGNTTVLVASVTRSWIIYNNTIGAFVLVVQPSGGTGITVGQGKRCILYFDGANVVRATADV